MAGDRIYSGERRMVLKIGDHPIVQYTVVLYSAVAEQRESWGEQLSRYKLYRARSGRGSGYGYGLPWDLRTY